MSTDNQTFVIAGAGMAGGHAAQALRDEGFGGRVVLVGAEPERPYERPPLSKQYLRGEDEREKIYVHPPGFYDEHAIELLTGRRAVGLDAGGRLALDNGKQIAFDRLLLAPGAEPRRLRIPGADLAGVNDLRTVRDSDALRAVLDAGGHLVVVGAGWIGAEVAASARERGMEVTLIDPAAVPLQRVLGTEVGGVYRDVHADHGVELLLGHGVAAFEGAGSVERVRTTDGRVVDCDAVVVGVGVVPRTDVAAAAGLALGDGILVDERLQTSVPGIYAAGDCASEAHPLLGRLRVEHWDNALHQGPAAARNMLGAGEPYARLPYFFSDQYDVGMEYSGHAGGDDRVVFRGDPATREFLAFWLRDGRVAAGMNFNVWDVSDAIRALIEGGARVDERRLADPDVPLEEVAPASSGV